MARLTTTWRWAAAVLMGMSLAPASYANGLWKCVDGAGVSHYVQKKLPTQRCSAVQQAPPPPSRPYLPLASASEPRPLGPAPSPGPEKPPLPLMISPLIPPLGLPPLPEEGPPPTPLAPAKN